MSSDNDFAGSDTSTPGENPFAKGASGNDGFSHVAPQDSGASSENPFTDQTTPAHGFGARPKLIQSDQHHATSSAEIEALLRPFFHHTNVPVGAEKPNGSLRLSRDWAIKMLGANQFHRADNGQLVLKLCSELKVRGGGGLKLPMMIIDWLVDAHGQDEVLVPAAVVRLYWTRPRYTDG
ncbi:hypothetical protein DPSP01_002254 [Paraphaeosphaeria sporulosa]